MTTNNPTNPNSADFTVSSGVFELNDAVVKTVASDAGSATPSSHGFTIAGAGGVTTSASGSTVTINGGGGGGTWTLLQTQTASSSAYIEFTANITSSYRLYVFLLENVIPDDSSADNFFYVRLSSNNGSTYYTGASDYGWEYHSNDLLGTGRDASDPQIRIGMADSYDAGSNVSGTVWLLKPSDVQRCKMYSSIVCGKLIAFTNGASCLNYEVAVNAIKFYFAIGNISTGTFRLYGVAA